MGRRERTASVIMAVTQKKLAMAFKRGLSRAQVAKKFKVSILEVDKAIVKYLRPGGHE